MTFYKRDAATGETIEAPTVYAPNYTLTPDTVPSTVFPVDGWWWFDTPDQVSIPDPAVTTSITAAADAIADAAAALSTPITGSTVTAVRTQTAQVLAAAAAALARAADALSGS